MKFCLHLRSKAHFDLFWKTKMLNNCFNQKEAGFLETPSNEESSIVLEQVANPDYKWEHEESSFRWRTVKVHTLASSFFLSEAWPSLQDAWADHEGAARGQEQDLGQQLALHQGEVLKYVLLLLQELICGGDPEKERRGEYPFSARSDLLCTWHDVPCLIAGARTSFTFTKWSLTKWQVQMIRFVCFVEFRSGMDVDKCDYLFCRVSFRNGRW